MADVKATTPLLASIAAATLIAAASIQRCRAAAPTPPCRPLRTPPQQLPATVLDRLRHPSAPAQGYSVRWEPATRTALWRPNRQR